MSKRKPTPQSAQRQPSDWRAISDEREKYAAYLCSREWAVLKDAVHKRAGGICERCGSFPIDAVHHKTYERKYREELEDLEGHCQHCHAFTHGKSNFDPVEHRALLDYLQNCRRTKHPPLPELWWMMRDAALPWIRNCIRAIEHLYVCREDATYEVMDDVDAIQEAINVINRSLPFDYCGHRLLERFYRPGEYGPLVERFGDPVPDSAWVTVTQEEEEEE